MVHHSMLQQQLLLPHTLEGATRANVSAPQLKADAPFERQRMTTTFDFFSVHLFDVRKLAFAQDI